MKDSNLLTIEHDFSTPMMRKMFLRERSKPKHKPLAGMRIPFQQNPKWQVCYGGR